MKVAEWQEITSRVGSAAERVGLDLIQPFNLAATDLELGRAGTLGVLIGNTRRLWPIFVRACREAPYLAQAAQPLDRYVTEQLTRVVAESTTRPARLIFGHVTEPVAFPIQRLAERVGLAALSPSHLAIHPLHGPWLALRAVVVVEVDGPELGAPALSHPCHGCSAPCVPALNRAIAATGSPLDAASIAAHARDWIAVRDACPIGRESRYGEAQLDYHYAPAAAKLVQGS